jgi:MoxR-like ATPase
MLEDFPGVGKTMLAKALALSVHCHFARIQFTPDLLPSDVTGVNIFNQKTTEFEFRPGPIFANVVLADEINRTAPRTQSALLEAMQEGAVTVGRERHALPVPFCVLATQNPVEMEGTFPLPEAQLDRFLVKILVSPPEEAALVEIFRRTGAGGAPPAAGGPVLDRAGLLWLSGQAAGVAAADPLLRQIARIVRATDPRGPGATESARRNLRLGASPRAGEAIVRLARIEALRDGRGHVSAADVAAVVTPALRHRLLPSFEAEARGLSGDALVADVLHDLPDLPPEVEAVLRAIER